jgi:hypothetical protein
MFPLGFALVLAGVWFADSAFHHRPPIATFTAILKDPGNMRDILDQSTGTTGAGPIHLGPPSAIVHNAPKGYGNLAGVVSYLEAQVGKPYGWGKSGPNKFDCSGLGYAAYRSVGISIPRTTAGMLAAGHFVREKDLLPGDAIFPYPGHVFWYVGGGLCVEAPHTGSMIHLTKIYQFWTARRFVKPKSTTSQPHTGGSQ